MVYFSRRWQIGVGAANWGSHPGKQVQAAKRWHIYKRPRTFPLQFLPPRHMMHVPSGTSPRALLAKILGSVDSKTPEPFG